MRPSACVRKTSASCRMVASGQEFRPSPMVCSSLRRQFLGRDGRFRVGREHAARSARATPASACSLTTAAALRSAFGCAAALRSSNCSRQRLSLIFESHHVSSVPISVSRAPSFTGISRSLGLLAEADHGVERRVHVQLGVARRELHHLAELVVGARERTVQAERDRTVGHQLQIVAIDFDGRRLLPRRAAPGRPPNLPSCRRRVRCNKSAAGRRAPARRAGGAHVRVVSRAARHREIEIAILENLGTLAVPVLDHVGHALAAESRE